ncbi:hypothetical protein OG453_25240 [Streptomyces sp. NBC_01381]|uniref:hypothetical protein n=1 Tax=Streptomyces sp. NBC_01381 TaxID=2903845 RepID=UPI002252110D|nr:hypothetical protein [Streptomyces sp. NBC_01381]MCX4669953.1 hypothetical protein [Streptomyces sp. NBC_01381]
MAEASEDLIKLERSAEEERAKLAGLDGEERAAQWRRWYDAAVVFQAGYGPRRSDRTAAARG